MMRKIKFREWDVDRGTLSYSRREDFDDMVGFRFEHQESGERILDQFTNLKDTNGMEIYENDIIEFKMKIPRSLITNEAREEAKSWSNAHQEVIGMEA